MKSELIPSEVETKEEYPCLKISQENKVVLFSAYKRGVVVNPRPDSVDQRLGYYSEGWAMSCFKPFNGKVILSNA